VTSNAIGAAVIYHFTAPSHRLTLEKGNLEADSVCGLFHFRLGHEIAQKLATAESPLVGRIGPTEPV
jgi:hypothetical protein